MGFLRSFGPIKKSKTRPPPFTLLVVLILTTAGAVPWAKSAKEGTPPMVGTTDLAERGLVQFRLAAIISPAIKERSETPIKVVKYRCFFQSSAIKTAS